MTFVATVGDLGQEHIGWLIKTGPDRGASEFLRSRTFTLKAIRTWTYQGVVTVGLVDPTDAQGRIVGTERHYAADAQCELVKPMTARARRLRSGVAS